MRVAVTGLNGQVVTSLVEQASRHEDIVVLPLGRPHLDLAQLETIAPALEAAAPDIIVSAAAYTAVDKAESDAEAAFRANGEAPGVIAATAAALGVPVIHISTDYVFDGAKAEPYVEDDPVCPLGVYGASKLAGEVAVQQATSDFAILRTAWVYSPFGNNFVKTMLRLAADRDELNVVADQFGAPTSALDIASAVIAAARQMLEHPRDDQRRGIFHLGGTGYTDWAGFAEEIMALSAARQGPSARVNRIATSEYPTPARRPASSRLNTDKLHDRFGIRPGHWRESLVPVIDRLMA